MPGECRTELQELMTARVGVLRSAAGLAGARDALADLAGRRTDEIDQDAWETTNLVTISTALAEAAARREETRGSHWRDDFPGRDDERFAGHFDARMVDGELALDFWPAPQTDPTLAVVAR